MANQNLEIDIYGDGEEEFPPEAQQNEQTSEQDQMQDTNGTGYKAEEQDTAGAGDMTQAGAQNLKRQAEDRPVDPGATAALTISELHWWINDDDLRGWCNESSAEDELQEITFSEHKVNGKSKGQVYMLFSSPQAATAVKHKIDGFVESQRYRQKFTVSYSNPSNNPYKTLPKDANARSGGAQSRTPAAAAGNSYQGNNQSQGNFSGGGFRGGRGGFNNRGGGNYNRGGYQQPAPGSFQGAGYQNNQGMGMQNNYNNNFNNRGNMMGGGMRGGMNMRGGRGGGMNQGMMNNWGNMGAMPNMMGMPNMGGAMNMQGFQNPGGFYQGAAQDNNWNPHGGKRQRQE